MSPTPGHHGKRSLYGKKKLIIGNRTSFLSEQSANRLFIDGIVLFILGMFILVINWAILDETKDKK